MPLLLKSSGFIALVSLTFMISCKPGLAEETNIRTDAAKNKIDSAQTKSIAGAATILAKKQVPVLCYHHIRNFRPGEAQRSMAYRVTPAAFAEQMKALSDSGYQTILPGQLYDYLVYGSTLPPKPIMISFDDTDEEQFSIGEAEMSKYGFKGVYFVMTISISRPRYMNKEQLKQLSDRGNSIEAHTWDHQMVTKYKEPDFEIQFIKPKKKLEEITGRRVVFFAYPFGLWGQPAITELKKAGYKMAFILSSKRDPAEPLYTIRRMLVPGSWSTPGMFKAIKQTFQL